MALPQIAQDFGVSNTDAQWSYSIYMLAQAIFAIPFAKVGEMLGKVNTLALFSILITIVNIPLYFITNFWAFVAVRFISGALNVGILPNRNALVVQLAKKGTEATVMML